MTVREMIVSGPGVDPCLYLSLDELAECIEACGECATACTACADACLAEPAVAVLRGCIQRNQDCADLCRTTGAVLSRQAALDPGLVRVLLEACTMACGRCAAECEGHAAAYVPCGVCAQACRRCEVACRQALEVVRDGGAQPGRAGSAEREEDDIEGPAPALV